MSENQSREPDGPEVPFDPYNFDPVKDVPSSSRRLVDRLVARVPELRPAYDEHIADYDVSLPHLFFADVTRWTVADYEANGDRTSGGWRDVVAFLEEEYEHSDDEAQAVIEQSFIENLPYPDEPGHGIEQHLGPQLAAIYRDQRPSG
ncbi:MAG: hypothetical protein J2P24_02685 [Streptosporangiales bacterium]|nr:hypothetical protein [Streptosporangiales bacterium]MBO0891558.1 hypothetical protein [Acidothermales bacterium]